MARCASMTCSCFTLVRIELHAGRLLLLSVCCTLTNVVGCTESRQWKKWSVATGEWPTARAAIAASMIGNRICFFGGFSSDNNDFAELVVLKVAISD